MAVGGGDGTVGSGDRIVAAEDSEPEAGVECLLPLKGLVLGQSESPDEGRAVWVVNAWGACDAGGILPIPAARPQAFPLDLAKKKQSEEALSLSFEENL